MREPIGECPRLGYDPHTVGPTKKGKREGAGKSDGKTTYLSISLSAARCRSAIDEVHTSRGKGERCEYFLLTVFVLD